MLYLGLVYFHLFLLGCCLKICFFNIAHHFRSLPEQHCRTRRLVRQCKHAANGLESKELDDLQMNAFCHLVSDDRYGMVVCRTSWRQVFPNGSRMWQAFCVLVPFGGTHVCVCLQSAARSLRPPVTCIALVKSLNNLSGCQSPAEAETRCRMTCVIPRVEITLSSWYRLRLAPSR